ncbi:hypothetical protein JKP88DRAFT_349575 [Tribonema minus]|uniref:Mitochondrial inner membrane protease subunit n=1 Tax=Tribonema minus TaxID=303371 RepID=A0A835YRZ1_9STRA|nr:hypothetical protein JKP88DRAFT_349575 [Tribonema minus]
MLDIGVEYRCLGITCGGAPLDSVADAPPNAFEAGDLLLQLRPIYPLIPRLERAWPVTVAARDVPIALTAFAYNVATAWAALTASAALAAAGAALAATLTLSFIPSRSMEPVLRPGDVVLVEKVSRGALLRRGEVVFFAPPPALRAAVADAGGAPLRGGDLFVKRVAALTGDDVAVARDGETRVRGALVRGAGDLPRAARSRLLLREAAATPAAAVEGGAEGVGGGGAAPPVVAAGSAFVLGDNPLHSVDSRVWGDLPYSNIVGRPLLRVFPLDRAALEEAYRRVSCSEQNVDADANVRPNLLLSIKFIITALAIRNGHAAAQTDATRVGVQLAMSTGQRTQPFAECEEASLDILRNEAVVHEVGVTEGTLQVKMDDNDVPSARVQGPLLCDRRWAPVQQAALRGDTAPLQRILSAAEARLAEFARTCACDAPPAVVRCAPAACAAAAAAAAAPPAPAAAAPLDVARFVRAFRAVAERTLEHVREDRRGAERAELAALLREAEGVRSGVALDDAGRLATARQALEWLLNKIEEAHTDSLNEQLRAVTAYLRTDGHCHERGLALRRLAAHADPLRATRAFVHRAVRLSADQSRGGCSSVCADVAACTWDDAATRAQACALLDALRREAGAAAAAAAAPPSPEAAADLLVRGVLAGALAATAAARGGAHMPLCEAPETLLLDGPRLQQSAAAVETAAAAAALAAIAARGAPGGLGAERTTQLLTLLEAEELTTEHVVAQVSRWAAAAVAPGGARAAAAAEVEGAARAVCERRSPLRDLCLRRCLMAVGDMVAARATKGGAAAVAAAAARGLPGLGDFLSQRAAASLLAIARHSVRVYGGAYAVFTAEAVAQLR